MAARYGPDGLRFDPNEGKGISHHLNHSWQALWSSQPPPMETALFPSVKWPKSGVDHPPQPTAEFVAEWSYILYPPLCAFHPQNAQFQDKAIKVLHQQTNTTVEI
jgi:hypothetical protein